MWLMFEVDPMFEWMGEVLNRPSVCAYSWALALDAKWCIRFHFIFVWETSESYQMSPQPTEGIKIETGKKACKWRVIQRPLPLSKENSINPESNTCAHTVI